VLGKVRWKLEEHPQDTPDNPIAMVRTIQLMENGLEKILNQATDSRFTARMGTNMVPFDFFEK